MKQNNLQYFKYFLSLSHKPWETLYIRGEVQRFTEWRTLVINKNSKLFFLCNVISHKLHLLDLPINITIPLVKMICPCPEKKKGRNCFLDSITCKFSSSKLFFLILGINKIARSRVWTVVVGELILGSRICEEQYCSCERPHCLARAEHLETVFLAFFL